MNKIVSAFLLCYIYLVAITVIDVGDANDTKSVALHRPRRFLAFRNKTHFFIKFNFKENMVQWNQLFAQALGFRMNWDVPPENEHPYKRFYRRDVYDHAETLLNKIGVNGFHCLRRAICEIQMIPHPNGIYHKLLKMIFRRMSTTERWHNTTTNECLVSQTTCPFSLLHVATFTDI